MKKTILTLATSCLLIAATMCSFSTDSNGHVSFFKKAKAGEEQWILYWLRCGDKDNTVIAVCGAGGSGCTPFGSCPGY